MNDGEIAFSFANFVIYCLLNINGGVLMSASLMAAQWQPIANTQQIFRFVCLTLLFYRV